MLEESRRRVQSKGFKCSETLEKDDNGMTSVVFHCNLPDDDDDDDDDDTIKNLTFSCREPSGKSAFVLFYHVIQVFNMKSQRFDYFN